MLVKLSVYCIRDPLVSWLHYLLNARNEFANVDGITSKVKLITSGVIQGSALDLLVLIIFQGDIIDRVVYINAFMFAHDLKLVYFFRSSFLSDVKAMTNSDISCTSNIV